MLFTYVIRRFALMIPTIWAILTLTFIVIQFVPGGPVEQMMTQLRGTSSVAEVGGGSAFKYNANEGMDTEQIEKLKAYYGFDKPWYERYGHMLWNYVRFDLGDSYTKSDTVWSLILSKLPVSMSLGIWTFLLTYLISVPLGMVKAIREGSRLDTVSTLLILVAHAIPGFVLGVLLLVLFAGGGVVQWFPLGGLTSDNFDDLTFGAKVLDYLHHITLPIIASVAGSFAVITLLTKNSFAGEMQKHYVLVARSFGFSERQVIVRHVMRNALLPLVTGFPAALVGAFFAGSLLIENLFSLDGLGKLSYEAVMQRDYPVVMGSLYLFTLIGLVTNLIADLCYVWVDPRIDFEGRS